MVITCDDPNAITKWILIVFPDTPMYIYILYNYADIAQLSLLFFIVETYFSTFLQKLQYYVNFTVFT